MAPKKDKKNEEVVATFTEATDGNIKDKKKKNKVDKATSKGSSKKVISIIVIVCILGGLVGIIYFNLFNIRDKYLIGLLQKIPIVNNLVITSQNEDNDGIDTLSIPELKQKIRNLESEIESKEKHISDLMAQGQVNLEEIQRLHEIEEQQSKFNEDMERFSEEVVKNDPNLFIKYYESIPEERRSELYREVVLDAEKTQEMKRYVATFQTMDEGSAAKILEELISTDMDLVVLILKNTSNEIRAGIISSMAPENGARVTKMMAP